MSDSSLAISSSIRSKTNTQTSKLNAGAAAKAAGIGASTAFARIAAAKNQIEGPEAAGSPAKPKATPTKKAPAAKKSPRKKRSASEAMEDGDNDDTGSSAAADSSSIKKARKGAKKVKEEIKEEEVIEDVVGLGHTTTVKAVKNGKAETADEEAVENEPGLTINIKAEEKANERTIATNNEGHITGNDATSEMGVTSEQVKEEGLAAPEISADILSHLAAHRSSGPSTGPSLPPAGESTAPFGYAKLGGKTQAGRGRSTTVNSVHDPHEADLAVDQFVKELDAESCETVKWEDRQDEKVFVA